LVTGRGGSTEETSQRGGRRGEGRAIDLSLTMLGLRNQEYLEEAVAKERKVFSNDLVHSFKGKVGSERRKKKILKRAGGKLLKGNDLIIGREKKSAPETTL